MKSCWYNILVGEEPDNSDCKRLHPNGCDDCTYYLPDPPEEEEEQPE